MIRLSHGSRNSYFTLFTVCVYLFLNTTKAYAWGFYGHKKINRLAIFLLPPEMITFYKTNIQYITESAVNPDKRRYISKDEAPRHYIDLDLYGKNPLDSLPRFWKNAVQKYTQDTLKAYGILPWHLQNMEYQLTQAFLQKDKKGILRLSSDLGHYIADAHVPLHTTSNYNGQKTGQQGIHGLWESRLPELFAEDYYFFFVKKAEYEAHISTRIWNTIRQSHQALDSVFRYEKEITEQLGEKKYGFGARSGLTIRVYSKTFCTKYHQKLSGQVERRMRAAVKMIADFWYTCWVDAGQPNLDELITRKINHQEQQKLLQEEIAVIEKTPKIESKRTPHNR